MCTEHSRRPPLFRVHALDDNQVVVDDDDETTVLLLLARRLYRSCMRPPFPALDTAVIVTVAATVYSLVRTESFVGL